MEKFSCNTENILLDDDGKNGLENLKKVQKKYGWNHLIHNSEVYLEHLTLCLGVS
jgi:hypothetical protein